MDCSSALLSCRSGSQLSLGVFEQPLSATGNRAA